MPEIRDGCLTITDVTGADGSSLEHMGFEVSETSAGTCCQLLDLWAEQKVEAHGLDRGKAESQKPWVLLGTAGCLAFQRCFAMLRESV